MSERKGHYFQVSSGKPFWPLDPRMNEIDIHDIANALSKICRFGGHGRYFYSVAQHSVLVSYIVAPELAMAGLLHDAAEAYVGDMVRPLKRSMPAFQDAEDRLQDMVYRKYLNDAYVDGEDTGEEAEIKKADNIALMTEVRDLLGPSDPRILWGVEELPLPIPLSGMDCAGYMTDGIHPFGPSEARDVFERRFLELGGKG